MTHKFKTTEKLTDNKWLNLFKVTDENGAYFFASRKPENQLVLTTGAKTPDAVRMLPHFQKDGKIYVVFIKEFRRALGKYIYGLPAGIIDKGEKPEQSAKRELFEEIGATTLKLQKVATNLYSSAGLTDESLTLFNAEVKLENTQHLEKEEDITIKIVELSKIPNFLKQHEFCMSSHLMALAFYYEKSTEQSKGK